MKGARKEDLNKAAWSWADTVDPDCITKEHVNLAYRINFDACKPGSCRRNCRGNPHCLVGLGENKWLTTVEAESWNEAEDPNEQRRDKNSFVGLKNLGATCYVNSLLQLWFHNIEFRKAIYSWKPEEDPQEFIDQGIEADIYSPHSSIGHLQLLFALLQFGNRRYIDPSAFIMSLGLDTTTQQDAQEFSKLFTSMLEERLSHQSSSLIKNIISQQFSGKYSYVTRCSKCSNESLYPSTFYELELNIKGHKTLADCLAEFLHEEKLEGADRYHCSVCNSKQDATRSIKLDFLPPVLNLQLLRFVFERLKGCKKKLNSFLQFPERLDMSEYVGQQPESLVYNLSAVLIHRGSSAYSGHYVAHICDSRTGAWFKFNDEIVEKMEGKKLKLGSEEDFGEGKKKVKPPRVPKSFLCSNNAYMLVYTVAGDKNQAIEEEMAKVSPSSIAGPRDLRSAKVKQEKEANDKKQSSTKSEEDSFTSWGVSPQIQELVTFQNAQLDSWINDNLDVRAANLETDKALQQEMKTLYDMLPVKDDTTFEFVSASWLNSWLSNDDVKPINNTGVLCIHGHLDPDHVPQTKCISTHASALLFSKYGGGPSLPVETALCVSCVKHRCTVLRLKNKSLEDSKKINTLLKLKMDSLDAAFWVGKNSLKLWRRLVLEEVEDTYMTGGMEVDDSSPRSSGSSPEHRGLSDGTPTSRSVKRTITGQPKPHLEMSLQDIQMETRVPRSILRHLEMNNVVVQRIPSIASLSPVKSSSSPVKSSSSPVKSSSSPIKSSISPIKSSSSPVKVGSNSRDFNGLQPGGGMCRSEDLISPCILPLLSSLEVSSMKDCIKQKLLQTPPNPTLDIMMEINKEFAQSPSEKTFNGASARRSGQSESNKTFVGGLVQGMVMAGCVTSDRWTRRRNQEERHTVKCEELIQNVKEENVMCLSDKGKLNTREDNQELIDNVDKDEYDQEDTYEGFNEDIICEHGNLCEKETCRRLVPTAVWEILANYFTTAKTFPADTEPCSLCQNLATEGKATRDQYRQLAVRQKESLLDLYFEKNRISLDHTDLCKLKLKSRGSYHLLNRDFVNSWRKFIRDTQGREPETCIENVDLLCPHGGLLYDPQSAEDSHRFVVVSDQEWNVLCSHYVADHVITITNDPQSSQLVLEPRVCGECVVARLRVEEMELLKYSRAKVFIHKVVETENNNRPVMSEPAGQQTSPTVDPEYQTSLAKRARLRPIGGSPKHRKSTRHCRMRGVKELTVSSELTLRDLKLKIMKMFSVAPFDQHLSVDGRDLVDNHATLGSLKIYPDSVILLKVDEPCEDPTLMDDFMKNITPEEGFKGTELLK